MCRVLMVVYLGRGVRRVVCILMLKLGMVVGYGLGLWIAGVVELGQWGLRLLGM